MRFVYAALTAAVAGGIAGYFWPAKAEVPMPMDSSVSIDGIETVCTGIGDEAQKDPRWQTYPVRIEFANGAAQYLSGAHVTLSDSSGKALATLYCDGAWVLFKVSPGNYHVTATHTGEAGQSTRSGSFSAPPTGQKRVILDFTTKNAQ